MENKLTDEQRRRIVNYCKVNNAGLTDDMRRVQAENLKRQYQGVQFSEIQKACKQGYAEAEAEDEKRDQEQGGAYADRCQGGQGLCKVPTLANYSFPSGNYAGYDVCGSNNSGCWNDSITSMKITQA